jgi:hypothetical protein
MHSADTKAYTTTGFSMRKTIISGNYLPQIIMFTKKMYFYTNAAFKANTNHFFIGILTGTYGIALQRCT